MVILCVVNLLIVVNICCVLLVFNGVVGLLNIINCVWLLISVWVICINLYLVIFSLLIKVLLLILVFRICLKNCFVFCCIICLFSFSYGWCNFCFIKIDLVMVKCGIKCNFWWIKWILLVWIVLVVMGLSCLLLMIIFLLFVW